MRVLSKPLFQIPQRYRFSSKSQLTTSGWFMGVGCFRYHKGTDFQANHNTVVMLASFLGLFQIPQRYRFSSKSQHDLFTVDFVRSCFRYHKGTDFQANHNSTKLIKLRTIVVLDTTKVQIFKQITTYPCRWLRKWLLFQIPQRYRFSSKSQHSATGAYSNVVVLDTTKVQIFKQITTESRASDARFLLFQIPQRYRFSSKSQQGV